MHCEITHMSPFFLEITQVFNDSLVSFKGDTNCNSPYVQYLLK